ncbi:MAG: methyltransferase domain-containing protein [Anaerolineae bacterium]|nr:methyltransferase domain-containing protein [Anaerolineae bacterium]
MDRITWLRERRLEAEERYSTWWAPEYGKTLGLYPNSSHLQFIQKFKDLLAQNSTILDAACGAGRYMPEFVGKGYTVVGSDQSAGMLARAKENFPDVHLEKVGLQEMAFQEMFDAAICMDAMEHICPEDWTVVLRNFQRALKQGGYLYFTVEIADEAEVKAAFEEANGQDLPVVYGEWGNDEVYHYYPSLEQVREWVQQAGFSILEEGEGDGYHHFLMRKL